MLQEFKQGPAGLVRRINEAIRLCKQVWNMRGDGTITVRRGENGVVVGLDINQLLPKIPKSGGATGIHSAFCKTDAGAGATIVCFLDTDTTGTEITVSCVICGGTALNSAFPRLVDGTRIFVFQDGNTWRALQIFQATEDC
jgi:hypothetical protein